ncbi:MAG: glycosyltransferase family 4 protein [Acidobacteriota bacterium]|nr:glycosyltransferase family 4 protein [Acidobacteriota bacterium]
MQDRAVVIVLPEWPSKGTGGPLGFASLLLRALLEQPARAWEIYVVATVANQALRLDAPGDLQELLRTGAEARRGLRSRITQYLFAKLPYSPVPAVRSGFARLRQRRRRAQQRRLQELLAAIAARHSRVLVHVHDVETGAKSVPACQALPNVFLVHTEHGKGGLLSEYSKMLRQESPEPAVEWVREQYETLFRQARAITFPSFGALRLFAEAMPQMHSVLRQKAAVILTGIPQEAPDAAPIREPRPGHRLFAIAQHVPEKGIDRMIEALAACKQQGLALHLRVAGAETVKTPELHALRDRLGLQENIEFLGAVSHARVLEELRQCDLYLACPRVVVFDLSLLEAMSAGVPIVTARLPGNVEALGEDYEGYFDGERELPSVLAGVLADAEKARRMGEGNRARCRAQFTLHHMVEQYLGLYGQVVDGAFHAHELPRDLA